MSSPAYLHSFPELARHLADRAEDVVRHLLPNGKIQSGNWCVGSVNGEEGQSLRIKLNGEKTGIWKDFATGQAGDLVELWTLVNKIDKGTAAMQIREHLGLDMHQKPTGQAEASFLSVPPPTDKAPEKPAKPISREYHASLRSRLAKSRDAMAYLKGEKRGLTQETIDYFGLGLSGEYKKDGKVSSNALVVPMRCPRSGIFLSKSSYVNVPGCSVNPMSDNSWTKGEPQTYFADVIRGQTVLFVCEGHKDLWRVWQVLKEHHMLGRILLISSTHGSGIPEEWKQPGFWDQWETVYLGQDNDKPGNEIAERVLNVIGREARRAVTPMKFGKDWTDFFQHGGTFEEFMKLLDEAPIASGAALDDQPATSDSMPRIGRNQYRPVDINGAYVNGHLYYPTQVHTVKKLDSGVIAECLETIVIRSDATVHKTIYAPAPPDTPLQKRILKLTDGTVVEKEPNPSPMRSWEYGHITRYLKGDVPNKPLNALVEKVLGILRQSIWLPYEEDYAVLALTVPVTYLQTVFESVPLLLLNGPAGSGKSQTGNVMAKICANGVVIGQVSAATAARLIDETRGFVVLDDVEGIAAKAGKDVQVTEFVQALKVSYSQNTAWKYWTDVRTMRTEKLNFFGVKMLNNTLGVDSVLGTRMIRIQTRKMPDGMKSSVKDFSPQELRELQNLRNELHGWAFMNVKAVAEAYKEVYKNKTDRQAEIAAPLRTMARLVGNPGISAQLETALSRQHIQEIILDDDPIRTLKEAILNLVKQGYDTVTISHIRLEMRALLDANYGMSHTNEIPEWDRPEWLGRQLRSNNYIADAEMGRMRVYGKNLRLVKFAEWVINEVVEQKDEDGNLVYQLVKKEPGDFCRGCKGCPYRTAGCEFQELRMKTEDHEYRFERNNTGSDKVH